MGDSSSKLKTASTQTQVFFGFKLEKGLDFCLMKDDEGVYTEVYVYDKRMLNLPVIDETNEECEKG